MATDTSINQQTQNDLKVEYQQICEHYRKLNELTLEISKQYMYYQFGLAAAVGFVSSIPVLQMEWVLQCGLAVNIPIVFLSLIGFSGGVGAIFIARTLTSYWEVGMKRAREIESICGWSIMTKIYESASQSGNWLPAHKVTIVLFSMIGVCWAFVAYNSVKGLSQCIM